MDSWTVDTPAFLDFLDGGMSGTGLSALAHPVGDRSRGI